MKDTTVSIARGVLVVVLMLAVLVSIILPVLNFLGLWLEDVMSNRFTNEWIGEAALGFMIGLPCAIVSLAAALALLRRRPKPDLRRGFLLVVVVLGLTAGVVYGLLRWA